MSSGVLGSFVTAQAEHSATVAVLFLSLSGPWGARVYSVGERPLGATHEYCAQQAGGVPRLTKPPWAPFTHRQGRETSVRPCVARRRHRCHPSPHRAGL